MYLICASPLARIFNPAYTDWLYEDTERIFDNKSPFEVVVKLANGDERFSYNVPRLMAPPKIEHQDDYNAKIAWLTGSDSDGNLSLSHESDCYGLVRFSDPTNFMAEMIATIGIKDAEKAQEKIKAKKKDEISAAMEDVKKLSHMRVMRAVRQTYLNLKNQYEANKEIGLDRHTPSKTEFFCGIILARDGEMKKKSDQEKDYLAKFDSIQVPGM